MIKAIIIEDELGPRESLKSILKEYVQDVEVVAEAYDVKSGIEIIGQYEIDILFLDIRLPDGESFEILDQYPQANFEVIFITAYSDYLQKAFDYFSFQYLSKPLDIDKLEKTMDRYRARRSYNYSKPKLEELATFVKEEVALLTVPHSDGFQVFKISELIRLEAKGSYTKIVALEDKGILSTKGLGYYEKLLEEHNFFRTHKSHLIQIEMVSNFSYEEGVLLKNNDVVPVAQRNRKSFFTYLEQYQTGK